MTNHRVLSPTELKYVKKQLKTSKKQLFWLFAVFVIIVSSVAFFIYSEEGFGHFVINVVFGIFILLIGALYWFFKGYKNHQTNPIVYKSRGLYERVYEHRGKNGAYYDTLNGQKVKLPSHWRKHLKKQKEQIDYEYILRDGVVAMNEMAIYIVSVDKLSLSYELENGLKKIKPISLLNILSFFLIIPIIIIVSMDNNFNYALQFKQAYKTPEANTITLKNIEALENLTSSEYIKINAAWVYKYKRDSDFYGENYIISTAERNRIYNHPNSGINYQFFVPSSYITKPDKAQLKKNLLNNPFYKNKIENKANSSIINQSIDKTYEIQLKEYKNKLNRNKKIEAILNELKPKSFILNVPDNLLDIKSENFYSIKTSLEKQQSIKGFYLKSENELLSIAYQESRKTKIKGASILIGICLLVLLFLIYNVIKIITSWRLKMRLVNQQLSVNNFKRLN